ncbi:MAG: YciI family protein [Luteolibacter sp.]
MNTQSSSNGYLLLFRGTDWHKELSPEEIQRIMGDWGTWFERLGEQGKLAAASPLENEGRVVSGKSRTVADGPFAEAKESIGGFFLLKVETMDEALEIAKNCPALPYGLTVEVRPVAPSCPAARLLEEAKAHSMA